MKIVQQVLAFCSLALLLQESLAAPASGLKGVKQTNVRGRQLKGKKKAPSKRACKYAEKGDQVKFSCKAESAAADPNEPESRGISLNPDEQIKDKITYKVSTKKEGVQVKVEYKAEYQEDETDQWDDEYEETKTTFEVQFDSLVEYAKGDASIGTGNSPQEQGYDWDFDTVVQTIPLTEWREFSSVMSDEEEVVSHFNTTTEDGMVAFNFTISRADTGEKATANSMKIDINIIDFPWMRDNTYVALMSTVKSKLKVYMEYDEEAIARDQQTDEPALKKHSKPTEDVEISFEQATGDVGFVPFGAYTWEEMAEAREKTSTTNVTLVSEEDEASMQTASGRQGGNSNVTTTTTTTVEPRKIDSIQVVATSPEQFGNETYQMIAYSFVGSAAQGASDIYWDPETGIGYGSAAMGVGFASSVVASLFVTGSMMLLSSF